MSILAITASLAMLYPVELSDPILTAEDTFVSDAAGLLVGENNLGTLHCLDTDEMRGYHRICLTAGEWQQLFDHIAQQDAAAERARIAARAQAFATNRSTSVTP